MPETTARELKLIQYLNEAYGKEKQLETVLQAQVKLFQKQAIKKRLQDHLKETKAQARGLEKRIKQLGGKAEALDLPGPDQVSEVAGAAASIANKAMAAAKGPIQALRGTSPADNQLRNLRDAFWNEAEEIAHYTVIEALAKELKDTETAKLAREYRRQEERVQKFVEKQLAMLVKEVVRSEVPKAERTPSTNGRSRSSGARKTSSRSSSRASGSTAKRSTAAKRSSSGTKAASSSSRAKSSSTTSRAKKSSGTTSRAKSGTTSRAKSSGTTSRAAKSSGTTSRAKSSGTTSRAKSSGTTSRAKSSASKATKSS